MEFIIKPLIISENLNIADELVGELHVSEYELNSRTAKWETIRNGYLEYLIECQQECNGMFLVAFAENKPIGFTFGYIEEKDNSNYETGEGDDLYVSDGYVKKEYRQHGVYTALNQTLEEHYKAFNLRRIYRFTLYTNTKMQSWLPQQGYAPVRIMYEKWLK